MAAPCFVEPIHTTSHLTACFIRAQLNAQSNQVVKLSVKDCTGMLMHSSTGSWVTGFVITDLNVAKAGGHATIYQTLKQLRKLVKEDNDNGIPAILV